MNLVNIIKSASKMLSVEELEGYPEISEEEYVEKLKKLMIYCINETISDLTLNYFPLIVEQTVEPNGDIIPYSSLTSSPTRIYAVFNTTMHSLKFRLLSNGIKLVDSEQKVIIRYGIAPQVVNEQTQDITGINVQISEYMLALGTAREFCLNRGRYNEASIFEQKFKDAIENAKIPKKSLHLKSRAWLN